MPDEREDSTIYKVLLNHEEHLFDLAGGQGKRPGLDGCRQERHERRVSGLHKGTLDRHASAQPAQKDGGARSGVAPLSTAIPHRSIPIDAVAPEKAAESQKTGTPLTSLHSAYFVADPEPTIRTGDTVMTASVLDFLGK